MSKKILIIEDEEYLVDMYTMKFESEGFDVLSANNGKDGLAIAKKTKPDLILLDLIMPKMDGYQVLEELLHHESTKNSLIYIFSNLGQGKEVERGLKKGADGYFVKSNLTPSQLVTKIKKILSNGEAVEVADVLKITPKGKLSNKLKSTKGVAEGAIKVLLIEDERPILRMYQVELENQGMMVEPSANGAWGLKLAKQKDFDVIIMDINMPAMNGFKAIEELRKAEKTKTTPIMVISNSAQDAEIDKAKKLGADCFLLKSRITPSRLVKEIKKRYPNLTNNH